MYRQKAFCTAPIRAATLLSSLVALLLLSASSLHAQDAPGTYAGVLSFVWGDQVVDGQVRTSTVSARLLTEAGEEIPLEITQELLSASSMAALQGEQVVVHGQVSAAGTIEVESLAPTAGVDAASASVRPPVYGSHPWLVLLCRGTGAAVIHENPLPFYDEMMGSDPYEVDHFWRELSYGKANVAGSRSAGWFDLPEPAAAYQSGPDGNRGLLLDKAAADCTAAADPTEDFTSYDGIVLVVPLPPVEAYAATWFNGGFRTLKLDGQNRFIRVVWMPMEIADANTAGGTSAAIILHEMGHGFGLPHSSGPYDAVYDSKWDIMSMSGADSCYLPEPDDKYGCAGQHTIAAHKEWLGWLDPTQVLTLTANSATEVLLNPLALPQRAGVLMIKAPISGSTRYYTVEARQMSGYDKALGTEAVIIHEVNLARMGQPAQVVDPDGNGDPNDRGAQWQPGERFDGEGGFTLCVKGRTPDGFLVSAGRNGPVNCTFKPDLSPSHYATDAIYPSAGQTVTLALELVNYQMPATNIVVTTTLPAETTYITGTAATTQGSVTVTATNQLVFAVGSLTYQEPVTLSYDVVVASSVTTPTVITHNSAAVWDQGAAVMSLVTIANPRRLYLPSLGR